MKLGASRARRWSGVALLGAALLLGAGARAEEPAMSKAPAAEDEARALATKVVHLVTPEASYKKMLQQIVGNLLQSMRRAGKDIDADVEPRLEAAVKDALPYAELIGWNVDVYARRFSAAELRDLITFYETPTGKKFIALMPELAGEAGRKIGQILPTRMPAALRKAGLAP